MNCLYPRVAYDTGRLTSNGKRALTFKPPRNLVEAHMPSILVPCGKCPACLKKRRADWVSRMRLEALQHPVSTFVTLTYNDEHCPERLQKSDVQNFLKRLRNVPRDYGFPPFQVRYFACGEYGKRTHRPHYHLVLFGVDLTAAEWMPYLTGFNQGKPRYASRVLERLWPYGFNVVGSVTDSSIKYVAKYAAKFYERNDPYKEFSIKSIGLGRSVFVDVKRKGRQYDYHLRKTFFDRYPDGLIALPDSHGVSLCRCPSCLDGYAERFAPALYEAQRLKRRDFALFVKPDMRSPGVRERVILTDLDAELKKGELDNA